MRTFRLARKLFSKKGAHPEVVTLFVTSACNARCNFCFYAENLNNDRGELSPAEWAQVASSMKPFSLLIMTGGEPFLNRQLAEIAVSFSAKAENIAIPTNGFFPDRIADTAEAILSRGKQKTLTISLSVDDLGIRHDERRGLPGGFDRILTAAEKLHTLKRKSGRRLILHTATVFSAANQLHIGEILDGIEKRIRPDSRGLTLVREPAHPDHFRDLDFTLYRKWNISLAEKSAAANYSFFGSRLHRKKTERIATERSGGNYISPCYAGEINAVIYSDGIVPLCETRSDILGNLREHQFDFPSLWSAAQAREATRRQQREKCRCGHECFVSPAIALNPGQLARTVLNIR